MPGFDRSGPMGAGPMTGGGRGTCGRAGSGLNSAFAGGYGYGRGLGIRRGRRMGWGARSTFRQGAGRSDDTPTYMEYSAPARNAGEEKERLLADAEAMEKTLKAIRDRIEKLETDA